MIKRINSNDRKLRRTTSASKTFLTHLHKYLGKRVFFEMKFYEKRSPLHEHNVNSFSFSTIKTFLNCFWFARATLILQSATIFSTVVSDISPSFAFPRQGRRKACFDPFQGFFYPVTALIKANSEKANGLLLPECLSILIC